MEITYFTPVIPFPDWFVATLAAGPIERPTPPRVGLAVDQLTSR